ncbi:unnamed protein product, partial [Vitis vinifera]
MHKQDLVLYELSTLISPQVSGIFPYRACLRMDDRCRTTIATKYPGFQFHDSDTIFKLINGSFFHS